MLTLISDKTAAEVSKVVQLVDYKSSVMIVIKGASTGEEFPVELQVSPGVFVPLTVDGKNILRHGSNFVTLRGRQSFRINKPLTTAVVGVYLVCATSELVINS